MGDSLPDSSPGHPVLCIAGFIRTLKFVGSSKPLQQGDSLRPLSRLKYPKKKPAHLTAENFYPIMRHMFKV
jgi:hypothetical protein